jgi:hypothetical protein
MIYFSDELLADLLRAHDDVLGRNECYFVCIGWYDFAEA